jgi:hypothetical protein
VSEPEVFTTTQEGGHALTIEYGDCIFWASCQCGRECPTTLTPDKDWNPFGLWWERHVMTEVSR